MAEEALSQALNVKEQAPPSISAIAEMKKNLRNKMS